METLISILIATPIICFLAPWIANLNDSGKGLDYIFYGMGIVGAGSGILAWILTIGTSLFIPMTFIVMIIEVFYFKFYIPRLG